MCILKDIGMCKTVERDCKGAAKRACAFRRYFLEDQRDNRNLLCGLCPGSAGWQAVRKRIYFWRSRREKRKRARQTDQKRDQRTA